MIDRLTPALFDAFSYGAAVGESGDHSQLRSHFDLHGRAQGIAPGPLFDADWYLRKNVDVLGSGCTAYDHFAKWGQKEGRAAIAMFDPNWYRARNMSSKDRGDPFNHFLRIGRKNSLQPGPYFWPDWYRKTAMAGKEGDPYVHYLTAGWQAGFAPNPVFDVGYYRDCYMLHLGASMDPLTHFVLSCDGDPNRSPHPLFDGDFYQGKLAVSGVRADGPAYGQFIGAQTDAGNPDPHPLFSTEFYRKARGTDCGPNALADYLDAGAAALLDPNSLFSKSYYYQHAPDVLAQGMDALSHYVQSGDREGRVFHPLFDPAHYRAQGEVSRTTLEDYLLNGASAGRSIRPEETPDRQLRAASPLRTVCALSRDDGQFCKDVEGSIGIFAHIFHTDCAQEILVSSNNAPDGATTVYISTDTSQKAEHISEVANAILCHPFEIRVCPNRGRDIAPFLVGFSDRLREVDFACHVHSKRSLHYDGGFDDWRKYLLDGLLGTREIVSQSLFALSGEGIGAVVPDHFDGVADLIQWGGNFETARKLMSLMGEGISREGPMDLPAGSMFWFRPEALAPLLDLNLGYEHFEIEAGQVDGTLAHAIERIFLPVVEASGHSYLTTRNCHSSLRDVDAIETVRWTENPVAYANRLRPTRKDAGPSAPYLPHTAGYLCRPSYSDRPRFNLLIPTVDRGKAYAGVSAAVDVFQAIRDELPDFDARVIATDVPIPEGPSPLNGYRVDRLDAPQGDTVDICVDGSQRSTFPVPIRENDIFMGTAWWTANQIQGVKRQQAKLFAAPPKKHVYLIQDFENGFEPWSTSWSLSDATYCDAASTIPVFNTPVLAEFFQSAGYYDGGYAFKPGINTAFRANIVENAEKEKIVLLYARPHAARNCLEFLDMVVRTTISQSREFWKGWRFVAIGEDFGASQLPAGSPIEIQGRLTLEQYATLASRAALAMSLMVSPHPSYPPLEMAAAGVRVLTNRFQGRDSAKLHENIESFGAFDAAKVGAHLQRMAIDWAIDPTMGWRANPKIDWFFGGRSNLDDIARGVSQEVRKCVGVLTKTEAPKLRAVS